MIKETISDLENTVAAFTIAAKTADINWEHKVSQEKWSNKEIIGHLIDSAQINLQRFVRCIYEENFKLVYEQDNWVNAQAYQSAKINNLITLWVACNQQIIHVLKNYPADRLVTKCDTGKITVNLNTVEFLASDYAAHMRHHLDHILEN